MIGIGGALEILHVTCGAGGIGGRQIVVVVHMAGSARHAYMRSRERKSRSAVVEVRLKPCTDSVAGLTIGGKTCADMIRRHCVLEIPRVAGVAVGR